MNSSPPMREFFYRYHEKLLNQKAIELQFDMVPYHIPQNKQNCLFAGVECEEAIRIAGLIVGYVKYNINPLRDRLHIHMIKISSEHRNRKAAMSVLWRLWCTYKIPIVPLHFYASADPFWQRARERFADAGALDPNTVRYTDEELTQWCALQHLMNPAYEKMLRELKASPEWPLIQARFDTWKTYE
jgi:hypothetical protein